MTIARAASLAVVFAACPVFLVAGCDDGGNTAPLLDLSVVAARDMATAAADMAAAAAGDGAATGGTTHTVMVGMGGIKFDPQTVTVAVGDTVHWVWAASGHTVTSGTACTADGTFCDNNDTGCTANPTNNAQATYDHKFTTAGTFPYFCRPHCSFGMTGTVIVQ